LRQAAGQWSAVLGNIFIGPMSILLVVLLLRVLVRRNRLAVGLAFVLFTLFEAMPRLFFPISWGIAVASWVVVMVVLIRFGLLATIVAMLFANYHYWLPVTSDPGSWYATRGYLSLALLVAFAGYGFYLSLAGRSLIAGEDLLGE
jgi:hypothetical protein